MAEPTPQGRSRSPSRFAAHYFDVEHLRKREGIDKRLQDFAARRPWLLRDPQQPSPETQQPGPSVPSVAGVSIDQALERLHGRVEVTAQRRRALHPDLCRALDESTELCDEYERMKRRLQKMGDELDLFG